MNTRLFASLFALSLSLGVSFGQGIDDGGDQGGNPVPNPTMMYVSLRGNDRWSGMLSAPNSNRTDGPKRTMEGARDVIRQMRRYDQIPLGGVIVNVAAGTYQLNQAFVLDHRWDTGTVDKPIVWNGAGPGATILDAAAPLRIWRRVTAGGRIPAELSRNVYYADLRTNRVPGFQAFARKGFPYDTMVGYPELFYQGKRQTVAQYPNGDQWLTIPSDHNGASDSFVSSIPREHQWQNYSDAWAHGYFRWNWADSYEKITGAPNDLVTFQSNSFYGIKAGQRYRFVNVLEELDAPGEYYIDRAAMRVYFYPPASGFQNFTSLSAVNEGVVKIADCQYVTFQGFTVRNGRSNGVEIHRGAYNTLTNLEVTNMGMDGVRLYYGHDNTLKDSHIYNIGESCVLERGGDRLTLTAGNHRVLNNEMHDYAQVCRSAKPAVRVEGCGNLIANNTIYRAPGMGIWIFGNNHVIEKNYLRYLCWDNDDAGAIYCGQDPTNLGNVVRYNLIEDLPRRKATRFDDKIVGIYLDDISSGFEIYGNIFRRVHLGMQIGGGRYNTVANNLFENCTSGIQVDNRGMSYKAYLFETGIIPNRVAAVGLDRNPYASAYPLMANFMSDEPQKCKGIRLEKNLFVGGTALLIYDQLAISQNESEVAPIYDLRNYMGLNPGLVDLGAGGMQPVPGGEAESIGFAPLDTAQIGVQMSGTVSKKPVISGPPNY